MLSIKKECPICSYGTVSFFRCSDGETIILLCDECSSAWESPDHVVPEEADAPQPPEFKLAGKNCSIQGGKSGWATLEEIKQKGWDGFIEN